MKEESHPHPIDPEIEARIVALVLGESSDFERDQLDRLIKDRPELAAFRKQTGTIHGLLKKVATEDAVGENENWKLPAQKRSVLLDVISGVATSDKTTDPPAEKVVLIPAESRNLRKRSLFWNVVRIAAVFCVAGFVGGMALLASRNRAMMSLVATQSETRVSQDIDSEQTTSEQSSEAAANWRELAGGTELGYQVDAADAPASTIDTWAAPAAPPTPTVRFHYDQNSNRALKSSSSPLAIQDDLAARTKLPTPYYLADEVVAVPAAPGFDAELPALIEAHPERRVPSKPGAASPPPAGEVAERFDSFMLDDSVPGLTTDGTSGRETLTPIDDQALAYGLAMGEKQFKEQDRLARRRGGVTTLRRQMSTAEPESLQRKTRSYAEASGKPMSAGNDRPAIDVDSNTDKDFDGIALGLGGMGMDIKEMGPAFGGGLGGGGGFGNDGAARVIRGKDQISVGQLGGQAAQTELGRGLAAGLSNDTKLSELRVAGEAGQALVEVEEADAGLDIFKADRSQFVDSPQNPPDTDELAKSNSGPTDGWMKKSESRLGKGMIAESDGDRNELDQNGAIALNGNFGGLFGRPSSEVTSGMATKSRQIKLAIPAGLNEKNASDESFSTFSLHVSDVSFKLARAALAKGQWPDSEKVRVEEFVNAFDYGDPMPNKNEKVACRVEQSIHPFLQQRNLLRVSMRTAAAGRSSNTPLRLTLLLDNSGSMERVDRRQTLRRAFALLAQQLKPIDQVTLISFARRPRLLADKISGAQASQLVQIIENLPSEGGTNIQSALQLAFEKAREQQVDAAQNRIILLTDGAVNLGDANPDSLSQMITTMRDAGIAFDAAGIVADGLNDEVLEALSRQGDGRYYLLDSPESADDGFARQIAGALRPSAKNVKVQIEFNPNRVGRYKLLGFEKYRLNKEDFRNDTVDAAEMAAAENGVAVYQFEAKPDGEGDVGSVSVRFRDLSTGQMVENRWPIPYQADAPRADQSTPALRIATSAALFAAKLRGEPLGETVDLEILSDLLSSLPERYRNTNRIGQLQQMIQQARQISGK